MTMVQEALAPVFRTLGEGRSDEILFGRSTTEYWPDGFLEATLKVRIAETAEQARIAECPGCSKACLMEHAQLEHEADRGVIACNQPEAHGLIEVSTSSLDQWRSSRALLAVFVGHELGMPIKERDEISGRARYGLIKRLGALVSLEFRAAATLIIGDDPYELVDLLGWTGGRICIDQELLKRLALVTNETVVGGKRQQRSRSKQLIKRRMTELRDLSLQAAADELFKSDGHMLKDKAVRELRKNPLFKDMTAARVKRLFVKQK